MSRIRGRDGIRPDLPEGAAVVIGGSGGLGCSTGPAALYSRPSDSRRPARLSELAGLAGLFPSQLLF